MIPFEEAFDIVMTHARALDSERVGLDDAPGRVLAQDVPSDVDMPPFNKSAMDGYACRRADLAQELTVIETIRAGCVPTKPVVENTCAKIMTGAPVPEGADCVIMVEYTENPTANTVRFTGKDTSGNICLQGEDVRTGDCVLRKGDLIAPQHIALLASVGCVEPLVSRRPRVGIVATGDEVVPPAVKPEPSQIRDANGPQLRALAARAGAVPTSYGIAPDTEAALDAALETALEENDVVLMSGGVSMGDYDFVPRIMKENGVEILFDAVAMKPGKPTTFGVSPQAFCIGLPGNPVSTFVQFELLVKPFLLRLMGHTYRPLECQARLAAPVTQKRAKRATWLPVRFDAHGEVERIEYHGSAHIRALCQADGLIVLPAGVTSLEKGSMVHVRLI